MGKVVPSPIYDRNNRAVNISKIIHTTTKETSVKGFVPFAIPKWVTPLKIKDV